MHNNINVSLRSGDGLKTAAAAAVVGWRLLGRIRVGDDGTRNNREKGQHLFVLSQRFIILHKYLK